MEFKKYDVISGGKGYKIKLYNIEDYLYNGDRSKTDEYELPYNFDPRNDLHIEKVLNNLDGIIKERNYDTFAIVENVIEEHLFTIEK